MRLLLRFFITLAILAATSGCGTLIKDPVTIKNEDLYYLKQASDDEWAVKMHFLTSGQSQVTKAQWEAISQGMACMSLPAFDDFNAEIAKLCSQVPCDYQQAIKDFFLRLAGVSGYSFAGEQ